MAAEEAGAEVVRLQVQVLLWALVHPTQKQDDASPHIHTSGAAVAVGAGVSYSTVCVVKSLLRLKVKSPP